jgi:hypothetical protein
MLFPICWIKDHLDKMRRRRRPELFDVENQVNLLRDDAKYDDYGFINDNPFSLYNFERLYKVRKLVGPTVAFMSSYIPYKMAGLLKGAFVKAKDPNVMDLDQGRSSLVKSVATGQMVYRKRKRMSRRKRRFQKKKRSRSSRNKLCVSKKSVKAIVDRMSKMSPVCQRIRYDTGNLSCNANECAYVAIGLFTKSDCDELLTSYGPRVFHSTDDVNYKIVNPNHAQDATNKPYTNAKLQFAKGSVCTVHIRNNDLVDSKISAYEFLCTDNTAKTVPAVFEYEVDQIEAQNISVSNAMMWAPELVTKKLINWTRLRHQSVILKPGQSISISVKPGKGWFDTHNQNKLSSAAYVRSLSKTLLLRIEGCLGHDTTNKNLVGKLKCAVDYELVCKEKFRVYESNYQGTHRREQEVDTIANGEQAQMDVAHEVPET